MGLLQKIRRHAAVAAGNFARMFPGLDDIPPLPDAAAGLLEELNRPEPEVQRFQEKVGLVPGLAVRILRTVNAPLFGLQVPVTTIDRALVLLGFGQVKRITLTYTMMECLPMRSGSNLDARRYWADALITAAAARVLARATCPGEEEEAYTAGLLADVALPVLAASWGEYYEPVLQTWRRGKDSLARVERQAFSWDHGQAGAWILGSWGFPDRMVCIAGAHTLGRQELEEIDLAGSPALPLALAGSLPSTMKPGQVEGDARALSGLLGLGEEKLAELPGEIAREAERQLVLFGLPTGELEALCQAFTACLAGEPAGT